MKKSEIMIDLQKFADYCNKRNWGFDQFTSEFTFQFRLCRFLESENSDISIELESNVERYKHTGLTKKEIDLDILTSNSSKIAIELKFHRDKGTYNIGMFNYCKDIKFLEELTEKNFEKGYAIIFTTIPEFYTRPIKAQNPKNIENIHLYNCFRENFSIEGQLQIRTGSLNKQLNLACTYPLNWVDFTENIKACIIEVRKH